MPQIEMQAPTFVQLLDHERTDEEITLIFLGSDNKSYRTLIAADAIQPVIDTLQGVVSKRHQGELLTLTVIGSQPAANVEGKALLLKTKEAGTIALALPDSSIPVLQAHLADLATLPTGHS